MDDDELSTEPCPIWRVAQLERGVQKLSRQLHRDYVTRERLMAEFAKHDESQRKQRRRDYWMFAGLLAAIATAVANLIASVH